MKSLLIIIAVLSAVIAQAEYPIEGKYKCTAERFVNMPATTADTLVLQLWTSKHLNPVASVMTLEDSLSTEPSLFGGRETEGLAPVDTRDCVRGYAEAQVRGCAVLFMPVVRDTQSLFVTRGSQSIQSLKLSGNYNSYLEKNALGLEVSFRKNNSHWERVYSCNLVK